MKKRRLAYFCLPLLGILVGACTPTTPAAPTNTAAPTLAATFAQLVPTTHNLIPTETMLPGATPVSGFISMHMVDPLNGWSWIGLSDGEFRLLHTSAGVDLWNDVTPKGYPPTISDAHFLDANIAWVPLVNYATNATMLFQTVNAGATWNMLSERLPFSHANFQFLNAKVGWAVVADMGAGNAHYQVYDTQDGGINWSAVPITPSAADADMVIHSVHLCNICGDTFYYDPNRIIIARGDMGSMQPTGSVRLSISINNGADWKDALLPLPSQQYQDGLVTPMKPVFFSETLAILPVRIQQYDKTGNLVFQIEAFYRTQDGGLTWQSLPRIVEGASSSESPVIISPTQFLLRCGAKICRTEDGASTWTMINPSISFSIALADHYVTAFQFLTIQTGWAIYTDEGDTYLYRTNNGGTTWEQVDTRALTSS
jgi:photosystem II stability/assembly factor-like uncharacterized protein